MTTNHADRPLRWGIMGTAKIATKVGRAMQQARGSELVVIASRDEERAARWARQHGVPRTCVAYVTLLDDPDVDAVYIPLPPSMHHEWTIRAAEAGKHVLCEKPLAASVSEAEEMIAACREHGVQLMDGTMWVHHARTPQMHRFIDEGTLGHLRRVTSAFSFNWDQIPTNNIRLQPDLAGGCLGDLGWYNVRLSLWAMGRLPQRVWATARYYNDVEMNLSAVLWFGEQQMASFDCGFDVVDRQWFEVAGTQKTIVCDDFVLPWSDEQTRFWIHDGKGGSLEHTAGPCVQEVCMIEDFVDAVRSGTLNERWPSESLDTMRVCERLAKAARKEKPLELKVE